MESSKVVSIFIRRFLFWFRAFSSATVCQLASQLVCNVSHLPGGFDYVDYILFYLHCTNNFIKSFVTVQLVNHYHVCKKEQCRVHHTTNLTQIRNLRNIFTVVSRFVFNEVDTVHVNIDVLKIMLAIQWRKMVAQWVKLIKCIKKRNNQTLYLEASCKKNLRQLCACWLSSYPYLVVFLRWLLI